MEIYLFLFICSIGIAFVSGLTGLFWQFFMGRDKALNDAAKFQALEKETVFLENLRAQADNTQRYTAHYHVLNDNKEVIQQIDDKIAQLLLKKSEAIDTYAKYVQDNVTVMIIHTSIGISIDKINGFKKEVDSQIHEIEVEVGLLQSQRGKLWGTHVELQNKLLIAEDSQNERLDALYQRHTDVLEKMYLAHDEQMNKSQEALTEASQEVFKHAVSAPVNMLSSFLNGEKSDTSEVLKHALNEISARTVIQDVEQESANMDAWLEVDGPDYSRLG